ncbi:sodium-translocating pyrophosphatase [Candidatus Saccharibacteria bacterium]|nr:sodium-translocating pyrophosphatase [Candidatus Saccharibacteria bacterium]
MLGSYSFLLAVCLLVPAALAIIYVISNYVKMLQRDEGTDEMREMASIIRSGASTFMVKQYLTVMVVVIFLAIMFSLFIEASCGVTFMFGALMSTAACILGMKAATYANVRVANRARETLSIGKTVKLALIGGSIPGLSVPAFGVLGLGAIIMIYGFVEPEATGSGVIDGLVCNPTTMRIATYSLGCSVVAMFNRVAGGNFTKAADISSDILAKQRHDLPEDDSRVPNVIADFIGDNVNDIAGNCSDLLESFVATISASIMVAVTNFRGALVNEVGISESLLTKTAIFPLIIAVWGLLSCVAGIYIISKRKMGDNPSKELDNSTYISAGLTVVGVLIASAILFANETLYPEFKAGWASPFIAVILGLGSGVAIGKITEYYTSTDYRPTRELAEIAPEGDPFVITLGDAIGSRSCLLPIVLIGVSMFVSNLLCGTYGVAIAALGMLSFVGATVSIDAFGPIADNAGGIAESCHLPEEVRTITDKLDAVGNTTAAIGKGFAIGSAAFATVSLMIAYIGSYTPIGNPLDLNLAEVVVVVGGFVGGGLIEYFVSLLTNNTSKAAKKMADVGGKMMTKPVIEGLEKPDYNACIKMATSESLKHMLLPSILAIVFPILGGIIFGVKFVGGLLFGATVVAVPRAIFMGNSGGAFDNAKKYIEAGLLAGHGKGSAAHKAAVTGDTVGDTRKDVVGVALDIFIKTMSTVANTLAPVFSHFTLFR